jgi:hypothetical protein
MVKSLGRCRGFFLWAKMARVRACPGNNFRILILCNEAERKKSGFKK